MTVTYGWCTEENRLHKWEDFVLFRGSMFKNTYYYCQYCKVKEQDVRHK